MICLPLPFDNAPAAAIATGVVKGPALALVVAAIVADSVFLYACGNSHLCEALLYGFLVEEDWKGAVVEDLLGTI